MKPTVAGRVGLKHLIYRLLPAPSACWARVFTGSPRPKACSHLALIQVFEPTPRMCADCVALSDRWLALRMCPICGYVGCGNDAKNQHPLKDYPATGHPLMRSIERGDGWLWRYVDNALLPVPIPRGFHV